MSMYMKEPGMDMPDPKNLTSPVGAFSDDDDRYVNVAVIRVRHITCRPSRATYTFNVTFVNGKRILSHTAQELGSMEAVYHTGGVAVNCPLGTAVPLKPGGYVRCKDDLPLEWNDAAIDNFSALNIYGVVDYLATILGGAYPVAPAYDKIVIGTWTLPNGTVMDLYKLEFLYFTSSSWFELPPSQILLRVNVFNSTRDLTRPGPTFTITQDLLNEGQANITIGTMLTHNSWTDNVEVTKTPYSNVYSFSRPLNLSLPYFIPLIVAPIYLAIGANSLRLNGVPAMDNSFVQLLMTSTGSRALAKTAAAGCLGGEENIPPGMKKLKVCFGELDMGTDTSSAVRRAGFGLDGEVRPLRRDALYGVADC